MWGWGEGVITLQPIGVLICLAAADPGFLCRGGGCQVIVIRYPGHNLPDKSCVADTAMQIELA